MGDGVLAYFGWPQAHEDDAERAVRAGLAVVEAVGRLRAPDGEPLAAPGRDRDRAGGGGRPGRRGRGAGAGGRRRDPEPRRPAAGAGRAGQRRDRRRHAPAASATCSSAPTSAPSRLKGFAEPVRGLPGRSATARRRAASRRCTPAGPDAAGRARGGAGPAARAAGAQAKGGEGQVVLLSGEPGIGKSRLLAALRERLRGEPHAAPALLLLAAPPGQRAAPGHRPARARRRASRATIAPEARLDKLEALLAPTSPPAGDVALAGRAAVAPGRRRPRLAAAHAAAQTRADLRGAAAPARGLGPPSARADGLRGRALDRPDLARAARPRGRARGRGCRSCWSSPSGPSSQPPWTGQPHVTALALNRLGRRRGRRARASGSRAARRCPTSVVAEIVERTDGVPLFVEELTKAVLEAGAPRADGTARREPAAAALRDPDHAARLADGAARPARPAAKEVAQVGAAIGREFSHELLAAVAAAGRGRAGGRRSTSSPAPGWSSGAAQPPDADLHLQARAGPGRGLRHACCAPAGRSSTAGSRRALEERCPGHGRDADPRSLAHHLHRGRAGRGRGRVLARGRPARRRRARPTSRRSATSRRA